MIQETQVTQVAVTAMIQVEMNLANPAAMTPETPMIPERQRRFDLTEN